MGDCIIKRKDGLFAYQLAVVIDDHFQGINQVVRGSDLLDSTPWQLAIMDALSIERPDYLHIPIITDAEGSKLSKQSHATPIPARDAPAILRMALRDLGQQPDTEAETTQDILISAVRTWSRQSIPRHAKIEAPAQLLTP